MLYRFEDYNKWAEITGYCNIDFQKAEIYLKTHRKQVSEIELQFFDAEIIATEEHLYFAILNTLQSFKAKTNISKSIAVETMLYASTKRQIQKAIEHIGVRPGKRNLAVIIVGEDKKQVEKQLQTLTECFGSTPDRTVLQLTSEKISKIQVAFQITQQEMDTQKGSTEKALVNLLIEHMALLATQF